MFSVKQKREIADKVQRILRDTNHPELPQGEISFSLHVDGAEPWSWADIRNNGDVTSPGVNLHNEMQDTEGLNATAKARAVCASLLNRLLEMRQAMTEWAERIGEPWIPWGY